MDAGNMLKPMLARGELRMVGATTLDEYRKHIEKDPALERRFQPVFVAPPSVEDTVAILRGLKERYEVHHGVRIKDEALIAAARLSDRYIGGRFLPDKAIDLIDEAGSHLRIEIDSLPKEIDEVERKNFEICLLLGTAFGATIGGVATLVGTPPNAFLAAFLMENYDIEISFARWMLVGVPVTVIMLPICWIVLTRLVFPISFETSQETRSLLESMRADLGPASKAEWRIGIVFSCVVIGWMSRPWISKWLPIEGLSDPGIVMIAAFLLFLIPSSGRDSPRMLTWQETRDLPWAILILFGGGLSLAASVSETGLAHWLGTSLVPLGAFGIGAIVFGAVVLVIFLTELTSNLATTATLLPVLAALALELGVNPVVLTVPVALAASCAFMLPVATPPNAIIYGSGRITIPQMAKAGLLMNVIGIFLLSLVALFLAPAVLL